MHSDFQNDCIRFSKVEQKAAGILESELNLKDCRFSLKIREVGSDSPWIVTRYQISVGHFPKGKPWYGFVYLKDNHTCSFKAGLF